MKLRLERDGGCWYVIDSTGLERVADTFTDRRARAETIRGILETGTFPKGWRYEPMLESRRWGRLYAPSLLDGQEIPLATVWLPQHTAFR